MVATRRRQIDCWRLVVALAGDAGMGMALTPAETPDCGLHLRIWAELIDQLAMHAAGDEQPIEHKITQDRTHRLDGAAHGWRQQGQADDLIGMLPKPVYQLKMKQIGGKAMNEHQ